MAEVFLRETERKPLKSGVEFEGFFPRANFGTEVKKKGASLDDTLQFIPMVVRDTLWHTQKIAPLLQGRTLEETCSTIWHFVFDHIGYRKDEDGKEQVRSPARTFGDRKFGVDCDCLSTFISSILTNLKIKHYLRVTKNNEEFFQHIYPIVPAGNGTYYTLDAVLREFNREARFKQKMDIAMDLEYLNGVSEELFGDSSIDARDLSYTQQESQALAELGALFRKRNTEEKKQGGGFLKKIIGGKTTTFSSGSSQGGNENKGKGGFIKKAISSTIHAVNRANPAATLLRTGILASMKLNLMKVPQQLKWSYLSDGQARQKGIDMEKFGRLKNVMEKLEKIFFGAGGKPDNLKVAILKGKGNLNNDVALSGFSFVTEELDEEMPLEQLLGSELYQDESVSVLEGTGALGEAVTAASITAASGAIAAIAALLKSIGNIFPKGHKQEKAYEEGEEGNPAELPADTGAESNDTAAEQPEAQQPTIMAEDGKKTAQSKAEAGANETAQPQEAAVSNETPAAKESNTALRTTESDAGASAQRTGSETGLMRFWNENIAWAKPVAITGGVVLVAALMYALLKPKKEAAKATAPQPALQGVRGRKTTKRKTPAKGKPKGRKGGKGGNKSVVNLM